jgi:hypothetical protein
MQDYRSRRRSRVELADGVRLVWCRHRRRRSPCRRRSVADEHLLDADLKEDDKPVILTPVPAPTPPATTGSSPQRSPEKVNENDNSITLESTDENYYPFSGGSDSEFTDFSNITLYSRYGIHFKPKTGETLLTSDPEKPVMSSE